MAISFWKRLEKKSSRVIKFRQHARNIQNKKLCTEYQNSYRLEPNKPFRVDPVDDIIKAVMECHLEDVIYDASKASELCKQIAAEIKKKILLKLNFDRYKIAVIVTTIEKVSQAVDTNLGFLCDTQKDHYTVYTLETQTFFTYCIVIGTYHE